MGQSFCFGKSGMHQVLDELQEDAETNAVERLRANLQYAVRTATLHPWFAGLKSYFPSFLGSKIAWVIINSTVYRQANKKKCMYIYLNTGWILQYLLCLNTGVWVLCSE